MNNIGYRDYAEVASLEHKYREWNEEVYCEECYECYDAESAIYKGVCNECGLKDEVIKKEGMTQ